jgi:hypothetical protein
LRILGAIAGYQKITLGQGTVGGDRSRGAVRKIARIAKIAKTDNWHAASAMDKKRCDFQSLAVLAILAIDGELCAFEGP